MSHDWKAPERLVHSSDDRLLRELLDAGRAEVGETHQLAAVMAKLGPMIDASGSAAAGGAGGAKIATTLAATTTAKIVGVVGVVTALAGSVVYVAAPSRRTANAPAPQATSLPAARDVLPPPAMDPPAANSAASVTLPEASAASETAATPRTSLRVSAPIAHNTTTAAALPAPAVSSMQAAPESEVTILQRAQDELRSDPARSLAFCSEHAKFFADGLLAQEREVIAMDALVRLGRTEEAAARGHRFFDLHPTSSHVRRIETLLGKKF